MDIQDNVYGTAMVMDTGMVMLYYVHLVFMSYHKQSYLYVYCSLKNCFH